MQPWEVDPYASPSMVRSLFTPLKKTVLGPTPQKDGQVLGLFDLLEENGSGKSPSGGLIEGKILTTSTLATPGKPKTDQFFTVKHSRTPASAGKRFMLDAFATPLKKQDPSSLGGKTPSSVSKLHLSTPSFLRRDSHRVNLPVLNENEDFRNCGYAHHCYIHTTPQIAFDVFCGQIADSDTATPSITWRRLTRLNLLKEEVLAIPRTERIRYESVDGWPIDAILIHPLNYSGDTRSR